jgi:hypothetical protein
MLPYAALDLARVQLSSGDARGAATTLQVAMPKIREQLALSEVAAVALLGAGIAARRGDLQAASRLISASSRIRAEGHITYDYFEQRLCGRIEEEALQALGREEYRDQLAAGSNLSTDHTLSEVSKLLLESPALDPSPNPTSR